MRLSICYINYINKANKYRNRDQIADYVGNCNKYLTALEFNLEDLFSSKREGFLHGLHEMICMATAAMSVPVRPQ